jgi:hypothetical protein
MAELNERISRRTYIGSREAWRVTGLFERRVAAVTGRCTGIGLMIAQHFLAVGDVNGVELGMEV